MRQTEQTGSSGTGKALREEEREEKNWAVQVGSRREPDVAATAPTRGGKEKIWGIGEAIQGDEGGEVRYGPCFGSTRVAWDFEYIDSVHHHSRRGAETNGIIGSNFIKYFLWGVL